MKLKIKMLKNLISVLCAATILTSSVAPSVGAFKEAPNAEVGVVDRVKSANRVLGVLKYKINDMLQKTRRESDKHKGTMNDRDKTELFQVLSCLENSAHMVNEFEEIVINDLKLVENIERELVSALLGWEHSDSVINMSAKLENINSMIQKHKQQQAKEENPEAEAEKENTIKEFRNVEEKFIDIYKDFTNWKKGNKEIAKVYEVSKVKEIRRQVGRLYDEKFYNKNDVGVEGAKEFIKLARLAIQQMEDFKEKYEQDEKAKALGGILTNLDKKNALTNKKRAFAKLKANADAKAKKAEAAKTLVGILKNLDKKNAKKLEENNNNNNNEFDSDDE